MPVEGMIAKHLWDEARSDRRVVPVVLGALVLFGVLAHFESDRAPLDAAFVAVTLLAFAVAVTVLCDLGLWLTRRGSLGAPFVVFLGLLAPYLVVLGLRDRGALMAFVAAAAGVSVVLLVYALLRR
jgi:hypothetical protein